MIILGLIGGTGYLMLFTHLFDIKVVEVIGAYTLDPKKIEEVAAIELNGNIFLQDNLKKEEALKKAFISIEEVKIRQRLPGTVVIQITEKEPIMIALAPPSYLLLDRNGEVIDKVDRINLLNAPMLTGRTFPGDTAIGQLMVQEDLRKALSFLNQVPENRAYLIKEITVTPAGIAVYPAGSYRVLIGEDTNVVKKLNILETLIRDSGILSNTIDYIDLSNPDKIIKKTKEGIS